MGQVEVCDPTPSPGTHSTLRPASMYGYSPWRHESKLATTTSVTGAAGHKRRRASSVSHLFHAHPQWLSGHSSGVGWRSTPRSSLKVFPEGCFVDEDRSATEAAVEAVRRAREARFEEMLEDRRRRGSFVKHCKVRVCVCV